MTTYKERLKALSPKGKYTQVMLWSEITKMGFDVSLSNICFLCNGRKSTLSIDKELKIKQAIETVLREWET